MLAELLKATGNVAGFLGQRAGVVCGGAGRKEPNRRGCSPMDTGRDAAEAGRFM